MEIEDKLRKEIKDLGKQIKKRGTESPHLTVVMEKEKQAYEKVKGWIE